MRGRDREDGYVAIKIQIFQSTQQPPRLFSDLSKNCGTKLGQETSNRSQVNHDAVGKKETNLLPKTTEFRADNPYGSHHSLVI